MSLQSLLRSLPLLLLASPAWAGQLHEFTSDASGFNTNSVWYDDGKEVTVIDAQFTPALAQQLVASIRSQTRSPITRVIVTHPNPDKFNGLSVFHALGAESIASVKTAADIPGADQFKRNYFVNVAKMFTDQTYPKIEPVKTTYSGTSTIHLKSGETLTLFELKHPGVSTDQTVVRIDKTGDLVVGDLVANQTHAWLEGGIFNGNPTPTLEGWKADLRTLSKLGTGNVYGGRGGPAPVAEAVKNQIAYLDKADAIVSAYVQQMGANAGELRDPAKAQVHWKAIQAQLVRAFPDYALPDLVGYSVYGLADSKLPPPTLAATATTTTNDGFNGPREGSQGKSASSRSAGAGIKRN